MSHRILHVVRSLDRLSPADDLFALAAALAKDDCEQSVAVLGQPGGLADEFAAAGIDVSFLQQRWSWDPTTWARLRTLIHKRSPTLVHTWDDTSRNYACAAAGSRQPVIAEQNLQLHAKPMTSPLGWPPAPNHWVTPSERLKVAFEAARPTASVSAIPLGVADRGATNTSRDQLLEQLELPPDAKLIGTASPLEPVYGVKELIWAADMVRVLHPAMRLLVVGDGPQRPHLERFASTAAEAENICFLGDTVRWQEIAPHLDVYWQGTEAAGVSPTALIETMAAGVPVVASDTPQHRDWIVDGQTGHLVRADDRAERTRLTDHLLVEIASNKSMGVAGRAHALEHFSLAKRAEAYRKLHHSLTARK